METNDYCDYKLSLALKKVGFDYPCYFYYTREDAPEDHVWSTTSEEAPIDYNRSIYAGCSMPLLSQAQKWLREKYGIHISVNPYVDSSDDADGCKCDEWQYWDSDIMLVKTARTIAEVDEMCDSYEQALSAGIEAALELLDNENK